MATASGALTYSVIYPQFGAESNLAWTDGQPDYYTLGGWLASGGVSGTRTSGQPTYEPADSHGGVHVRSWVDDYYNRIHITPSLIAVGNLVSGVAKTVSIWNAWLDTPHTLDDINGSNAGGITLSGPSIPLVFNPLQSYTWTVNIGIDGPPVIAALFSFQFDNGESVSLSITGQRISAWALSPDWSAGVSERLEFKTDVMQAWSGAEQRRALRIAPRRTFSFDVMMSGQERRFIESQLFEWSARVWALPIWPDGQRLPSAVTAGDTAIACDTVGRDFVAGGLAIILSSAASYEVLQVTSFTTTTLTLTNATQNSWPAGSRIYPVRSARMLAYPKIMRDNGDFATAKPTFQITDACDWPAATGLPTYRTASVLEDAPAEGGLEMTYSRETVVIDGETGAIYVDDRTGVGMPTHSHDWFMRGRTARTNFRALLYLLKGRQGEMWVPTYQQDLKITAPMTSAQATIDIEFCGYTLYLSAKRNRQDIRIELKTGTVFYRRITGASVLDANTERLSIDAALGVAIVPSDVRRVSYMAVCRLNSDSIEIMHHTAVHGLATAVTPWQALNRNL